MTGITTRTVVPAPGQFPNRPDAVVLDLQPNFGVDLVQKDANLGGSSVPARIVQRLLGDSIKSLDPGGTAASLSGARHSRFKFRPDEEPITLSRRATKTLVARPVLPASRVIPADWETRRRPTSSRVWTGWSSSASG